jgi:tRNA(Ile2) C34 agmatinyltransferase TiaS
MVIKRSQSSQTQNQITADAGIAEIARPSIFEMMGIDELAPPRPRCPACDMRMVSTAGRHECLRCGHVQPKPRA